MRYTTVFYDGVALEKVANLHIFVAYFGFINTNQFFVQPKGRVTWFDHQRFHVWKGIVEAPQAGDAKAIDELCKAIDRYMNQTVNGIKNGCAVWR